MVKIMYKMTQHLISNHAVIQDQVSLLRWRIERLNCRDISSVCVSLLDLEISSNCQHDEAGDKGSVFHDVNQPQCSQQVLLDDVHEFVRHHHSLKDERYNGLNHYLRDKYAFDCILHLTSMREVNKIVPAERFIYVY